jgi:hypothetical protein
VGLSFSVEETVQGFSTSTSRVWIHSLVDLGHSVEQAPGSSWQELRMARSSPFAEHLWHLRRGNCSRIEGSYHDVVSSLVVDPRLVVDPDVLGFLLGIRAFEPL